MSRLVPVFARFALLTLPSAVALSCVDRGERYAPTSFVAPPRPVEPTLASSPVPSAAPSAPAGPGCGKPARPGVLAAQRVSIGGRDRTYALVVPEAYAAEIAYPIVFVLHGGGGDGKSARAQTDLERVAAGHAIFVYPDAISGNWDLESPAASNGDVALFDALLLTLHNTLCTDPRRVFVTGFSNGAYMANQLACRRGERIRAVVTQAGGGPYELKGNYDAEGRLVCAGKSVASLVVHGTADRTVAPSEGQKSIDHWARANRCSASSSPAWLPPCVAFQSCFLPVGTCQVPGLGHGLWREAGRVTWMFFESFR